MKILNKFLFRHLLREVYSTMTLALMAASTVLALRTPSAPPDDLRTTDKKNEARGGFCVEDY